MSWIPAAGLLLATLLACTTTDDTGTPAAYTGDTGWVTAAPYIYEWAAWLCRAPACYESLLSSVECVFYTSSNMWALESQKSGPNFEDACLLAGEGRYCIGWLQENPQDATCTVMSGQPDRCYDSNLIWACNLSEMP